MSHAFTALLRTLKRAPVSLKRAPLLEDTVMNHLAHILRDWDAFLVRLSRVDESSQSGTSFPESATSFEYVIMHNVAHVLHEWNVGLESVRLQLSRNESL